MTDNNRFKIDLSSKIINEITKKLPTVDKKESVNKELIRKSFSLILNLNELLSFYVEKLPNYSDVITLDIKSTIVLSVLKDLLSSYYSEDMFDDECEPRWNVITKFDKNKRNFVIGVRKYLKKEFSARSSLKEYVAKRDINNFLDNFKAIFDDLLQFKDKEKTEKEKNISMLDEILVKIKDAISNNKIDKDDIDETWGYIESIVSFL